MANIIGNVYYNATNALVPGIGFPGVPVVLYHPLDGRGLVVTTDPAGQFVFQNVPDGSYQVIEAWGAPGAVPSPGNYATSGILPSVPPEAEPPLTALPVAPPPLADYLMALSPNLLNVNVTGGNDVTGLYFYDAPVGSKPITFNGINFVGSNLITVADNGSFGTIPAGSLVNTIPGSAPYPAATPGLPYQAAPEITDGHYSIVNIRNMTNPAWAWWNLSDHETMLENGRFMFVNGDNPGAILFTQTVNVAPNTNYVMTGWVMNLLNIPGTPPRFSFKVTGNDGTPLGYQLLNSLNLTAIPVWYQNGFLFNSAGFSNVTVEVISEAPFSLTGNDYVIDEMRMFKADITDLLTLDKTFTPSTIYSDTSGAGQDVLVSVNVTNTSSMALNNVFFQDILDPQFSFVGGSVTVNGSGVGYGSAIPTNGFSIGTINAGQSALVQFHVTTLVPGPVTIPNAASATYDAALSGNGDIIRHTVNGSTVYLPIVINKAVIVSKKSVDKIYAKIGDVLTYTLTLQNTGNVDANNIVITDTVPNGTTFIPGSVTGATGTPPTLTVNGSIAPGKTATVTFKVQVGNTMPDPNPIPNFFTDNFTYTFDPAKPDSGIGNSESNTVNTLFNIATINIIKDVDKSFADLSDTLTYTLTLNNTGNVAANNVTITDAIPLGTTYVAGSLTGATGTPPTITLTLPIPANGSATVTFKVKIGNIIPSTNPIPNNALVNYSYIPDPTNPTSVPASGSSNTVNTLVSNATLTILKTVDKNISYIGDTITYSISVKNTGNVPADNVIITDLIPIGTVLVLGSVTVSAPYTGSPDTGIQLTNSIPAGGTVSITFKVMVEKVPNPNPIENHATTTFEYTVNPNLPDSVKQTVTSNVVSTVIFRYNFDQQVTDLIQSVALEEAALGNIANAEGAKIQAMVAMGSITPQELLCVNKSVSDMMESITMLENILKQKLNAVSCQIDATGTGC